MRESAPCHDSSVVTHGGSPEPPQTNRVGRQARLARLAPLAEQQLRVVSRSQLSALGWTAHMIDHEIQTDRWHLVDSNVIALQNAPLVYDQRLWLGLLHAGPRSALTHLAACRHSGLRWKAAEVIDLIGPRGHLVAPLDGFFFHQTRRPYSQWVKDTPSGLRVHASRAAGGDLRSHRPALRQRRSGWSHRKSSWT